PNLAVVLLGEQFREPVPRLIPWVALGTLLGGFTSFYVAQSFQLGRRTAGQLWAVIPGALTNLVLNLWLIPLEGTLGSAHANVAAYALNLLLTWRLSRHVFRMPFPLPEAAKIALAAALMAGALAPLRQHTGA